MGLIRTFVYAFIFLYVFYYFFGVPVNFLLRVKAIKDIATAESGVLYSESSLRYTLHEKFHGNILDRSSSAWFPFNSGGLHGRVSVLYASFTEFLVLYHAELETTGSTGRHFMNVSASVLQGQMSYVMDTTEVQTRVDVTAGENYVLRAGHSALVTMKERTTLLVYGRGFVPLTMGYWISETLLVNHDPLLALTTIFIFLKACVLSKGSILYGIGQLASLVLDYFMMLPELLIDFGTSAYHQIRNLVK